MEEFDIAETKMNINNFLWENLPGTCTMSEAEDISIAILRMVEGAWDGHLDRNSKKVAARD